MKSCRIGTVGLALASFFTAAVFAIGVPTASAVTSWVTTQLTFGSTGPQEMQISGNRVVWMGFDGTYTQIFTQKLGVDAFPSQLTTDASGHDNPQVSGDRVVWQGDDGVCWQIFTQKIGVDAAPIQLTTDASDHRYQVVSNDRVVWTGGDGIYQQVFTRKLGTDASAIELTTDAHDHSGLAVDGDRVVWEQADDAYHRAIYTQKLGVDQAPFLLTAALTDNYRPRVDGDRVAWIGNDPVLLASEVFTWEVGDTSPSEITTDPNNSHEYVEVSGDRIVWQGWADYHPQIYTQVIGVDAAPIELTTDRQHYHQQAHVSGDRVVWSAQTTAVPEPAYQVFTQLVGVDAAPVQLTSAPAAYPQQYPLVAGDRIVWQSYDGTYQQLSAAGPACRLHYAAGPNGSVEGSSTQVVAVGGSCTQVRAVPAPGYRFVEWSDHSVANPRTDVDVAADATFTATFAINPVYSTSLKLSGLASVKVKKSYKVSGTIKPSAAVGRVKILWKRYYSGSYHTAKTVYATIANGRFSSSYKPTKRGKWRAYVSYAKQYAATATYNASKTVYKAFTVK